MTKGQIIERIRYYLEFIGDGGYNPMTTEEEEQINEFLDGLAHIYCDDYHDYGCVAPAKNNYSDNESKQKETSEMALFHDYGCSACALINYCKERYTIEKSDMCANFQVDDNDYYK